MKVYKIKVNGKTYRVELESIENVASAEAPKAVEQKPVEKVENKPSTPPAAGAASGQEVLSPIQGVVAGVSVKVGDKVKKGDVLLVIEAMKLENPVVSPFDGEVAEVLVSKGQNVTAKERIIIIR